MVGDRWDGEGRRAGGVSSTDPKMTEDLTIRMLAERDAPEIASTFRLKPQSLFLRYFSEQAKGQRTALVAFLGTTFAGYVTVKWQSDYLPFREGGIPEINDLNVLPQFRRRGIATALVARAEALIADRCPASAWTRIMVPLNACISAVVTSRMGRA